MIEDMASRGFESTMPGWELKLTHLSTQLLPT